MVLVPNAKVSPDALATLNLVRICEKMHTLPLAGGLLDQDYLFVLLINDIFVWDEQRAELDRRKDGSNARR